MKRNETEMQMAYQIESTSRNTASREKNKKETLQILKKGLQRYFLASAR